MKAASEHSILVYAASAHDVTTTMIQGRIIMENRSIPTVDVADVREHMRDLSRKAPRPSLRG
jgi:cytosine/adenosine deaminase-related metal-dependent hydrolase